MKDIEALAKLLKERYGNTVPTSQAASELKKLLAINTELLSAAEDALETLIGCCVPAGGVDDKKTILETQSMLREVIRKARDL